jgi:uncharacterized protein YaiL (DUF2058 family)
MADSLRDQLIAAGFEAPKKEPRKKPKGPDKRGKRKPQDQARAKGNGSQKSKAQNPKAQHAKGKAKDNSAKERAEQESAAKIEERKKLKAQIKALIDVSKTEKWKGESVYRYLVDKKIRELYVSEDCHPRLTAREVAITRYNGETFIVPRETGLAIKQINPQWSVFNLEEATDAEKEQLEGDYADYQVPDDLQW